MFKPKNKQKIDPKSKERMIEEKNRKINERKKTFKKLNEKTRRGQPVMKNKIEHLFNKIKANVDKEVKN